MNKRHSIGVTSPFELLSVGGTSLAVSSIGAGRPVICLHATGHGGRDFEAFANSVAGSGFRLVLVDWPGHGNSPPDALERPPSGHFYADLIADLVPLVCKDQQPIIIGNSIGGAAALEFACRYPNKVSGVVLCNPGGLAPLDPLAKSVIGAMVSFFDAGARGARWFKLAFAAYYRLVLPAPSAADQRHCIIEAGLEMAPTLRQAWDSFRQPEADLRQLALTLDVPTLFAWSKSDQIIAWARSKKAVMSIPHAVVKMFKGGHSAFLEDPDAFAAAFMSFAEQTKVTTPKTDTSSPR